MTLSKLQHKSTAMIAAITPRFRRKGSNVDADADADDTASVKSQAASDDGGAIDIWSGSVKTNSNRSNTRSFRGRIMHEHGAGGGDGHGHGGCHRGDDVFDRYEIVDLAGEGSLCTVWSVRRRAGGASRRRLLRASAARLSATLTTGVTTPSVLRRCISVPSRLIGRPRSARTDARLVRQRGKIQRRKVKRDLQSLSTVSSEGFGDQGSSERLYALKAIHTSGGHEEDLFLFRREIANEIKILKHLDHPNIVRVFESFDRPDALYLVTEYCGGGDLYERSPYTEREAANIVSKILSAVQYMHKNGVVHRDLKFENIMYESDSPDAEIKIIDFGLSKKFRGKHLTMTERVGTVYTMAPQVLQGVYTFKADIWAVGVIAYMLLGGRKPFWGKKRRHIVDKIMRCQYDFRGVAWQSVSQEAKDFVSSLLKMSPWERPDADEALRSEWLSNQRRLAAARGDVVCGGGSGAPTTPRNGAGDGIMGDIHDNLRSYARDARFKKLALMLVAHRSTAGEIVELRGAFDEFDADGDGVIDYEEFRAALVSRGTYTEEELNAMFRGLDVNENGVINYTEFLAATLETQGRIENMRLAEAFDRMDVDRSGFISRQNLLDVLGSKCSEKRIQHILSEVNVGSAGEISYEEFLELFRERKREQVDDFCHENNLSDKSSSDSGSVLLNEDAVIPGGKHCESMLPNRKDDLCEMEVAEG